MQAFLKGGSAKSGDKSGVTSGAGSSGVKAKSKVPREQRLPWVEKYRPKTVDEVAHQDEVVAVLKKSVLSNDLPNLLFYGPPGTGKTSTILAVSKELFGDMYKQRVLELNASDERGIQVVREKVKNFASLTASATSATGKAVPPFKIIVLDECDSMTQPAQAALRRTMEKHSKTTRFCLICNYVSRIIEPITSRCAKFRFKPLADEILRERLIDIATKENIEFESEAIDALLKTSEGDMRKAITYLQSCGRLHQNSALTRSHVYEIAGVVPDDVIHDVIAVCRTNSYEKLQDTIEVLVADGYSASQFISQLHDVIVAMDDVTDKHKSAICERLALTDKRLMDGADEYLQIMDLCTVIMQQLCNTEK